MVARNAAGLRNLLSSCRLSVRGLYYFPSYSLRKGRIAQIRLFLNQWVCKQLPLFINRVNPTHLLQHW
jgi:hypothetical protein